MRVRKGLAHAVSPTVGSRGQPTARFVHLRLPLNLSVGHRVVSAVPPLIEMRRM
jgi:hypothetical protein